MGGNSLLGQCTVCLMPEADFIAQKVIKKDLTDQQAAKELNVKLRDWLTHYELHVRNKIITALSNDKEIEVMKDSFIDKIKEARESMSRVITLTKQIASRLEELDNQKNLRLIQTYAGLEKNVIDGIKTLALLEGELSTATTINIQNNTLKVDTLMNIIMEEATPAVKENILKRLKIADIAN